MQKRGKIKVILKALKDFIFFISAFERGAIEKAREIRIEDQSIRYIQPEDLVVQKIIAGRAIDLEDARGILNTQGEKIDRERIERDIIALSQETGEKKVAKQVERSQKKFS